MAVTAGHFNSEIENWRNVLKAINYWFNTFSGKYQWQKNKINNQDYGWLMAGQPGSQCMSCIMLDVDIRTKSKQIDKKYIPSNAMELLDWNPPSLTFDWRTEKESKSTKSIQKKEILPVGWEKEWVMWQVPTVRQHIWSLILLIALILDEVLGRSLNDCHESQFSWRRNKNMVLLQEQCL